MKTAAKTAATHLIAAAVIASVGFSGGVALSQGTLGPRLAKVVAGVAPAGSSALTCLGVDDEGAAPRFALHYAGGGDEDAWCALR